MTIGFCGAGNMAFALAKSFAEKQRKDKYPFFDTDEVRCALFEKMIAGSRRTGSNSAVAEQADVVILAVKPQVIDDVLADIKNFSGLAVSIAAGVRLAHLETKLPNARIIRVMPNTPCLVGAMAAGFSAGTRCTAEDSVFVKTLLDSAGVAIQVDDEDLDAVTALSGSGPAFFARIAEYFIGSAIALGLERETARLLCLQTMEGTALLLKEPGMTPESLIDMVSSPGGTTVAGRKVLEESDLDAIIAGTIRAAFERSRELAG